MSFQRTKSYLASFPNFERAGFSSKKTPFILERIRALLGELNCPHELYPCLHVAGTNGKGATCAFVASLLREAGLTVGLYTSPHLITHHERIRVLLPSKKSKDSAFLEGQIPEQKLREIFRGMGPAIKKVERAHRAPLTYFEAMTAAAFVHFARKQVDVAVLETGLGGRLDATNVTKAAVYGLTPISQEHMPLLGTTLAQVAREKSAIIKPGASAVVVAVQGADVLRVIRDRCRKAKAPLVRLGKEICYQVVRETLAGQVVHFSVGNKHYQKVHLPFVGEHQAANAAMALAMVEYLEPKAALTRALVQKAFDRTTWPGRFEVVQGRPDIILDAGHNPGAMEALVKTVKEFFADRDLVVVLGVSSDKDIPAICAIIRQLKARFILTRARHPRAYDFSKADAQMLFAGKEFKIVNDSRRALVLAKKAAGAKGAVLVTGSIFLLGELTPCIERA